MLRVGNYLNIHDLGYGLSRNYDKLARRLPECE
jgi:hypothetical protein